METSKDIADFDLTQSGWRGWIKRTSLKIVMYSKNIITQLNVECDLKWLDLLYGFDSSKGHH